MHQSIATIDSPEFINLQPLELNPLMSSCEIKVLYIGENRNHSFITKEVATEMSKTLRGAPIVGYYRPEKEDFADHGEKITLDDQGITFECMTTPYGFVAPDAKVWFQKFEDYDDFGNSTVREYLMTTGYLWTGQFKECATAVEEGKPQSMELDEETLDGKWSTNTKTGMDFFIINDATFSKLCILGDDVEPCFEGASVTAPEVSKTFSLSLDKAFKTTLFNMMQDLKNFALKGGETMELENSTVNTTDTTEEKFTQDTPVTEDPTSSFGKKDDEENKDKESNTEESDPKDSDPKEKEDKDDKKDKKPASQHQLIEAEYEKLKNNYSSLEATYSTLQNDFADLQNKYNELATFKANIDAEKKDELIQSFYMLSDEDKKDVIENKDKYSYDDIEAKLSVICVRKKVNFDLETSPKNENIIESNPIMTFNLDNTESSVPAFVSALKNARKDKNI